MFLRDLKIGKKLIMINLISASLAMLISICFIAITILIGGRNNLIQDLNKQAYILGESLAESIAFNDTKSAETILSTLRWSSYIEQVIALNDAGQIFISYPQRIKTDSDEILTNIDYFSKVYAERSIYIGNQEIGQIHISATLNHIYVQLNEFIMFTFFSFMLACTLGMFMLRRLQVYLIQPIAGLAEYMRLISRTDDYSLRFHLNNKDELGELTTRFNTMLDKIQSHQIKLNDELIRRKEAENRLHRFAFYDSVTRLPNRHYFKERLENVVTSTLQHNTNCSIMLIDLDDFKNVNDTLGHHVGDNLLLAVAQRLSQDLRNCDVLCRIGGDEFAMILENTQDSEQVEFVAKRIIAQLTLPFTLNGNEIFIGASIGISFCPRDTTDIPTLLRNADNAMYSAKSHGKNHCLVYEPEMEAKSIKRFTLEHALRRAMEQNELSLHYQPLIDIKTNKIVGFEALLRWHNAVLGSVNPADFVPIAEEIGLIVPIGELVLRTACLHLQQWKKNFAFDGTISVNLSGRQLAKSNIVEDIVSIVESSEIPFNLLNIELTESILMDHSKETLDKLNKLNQLGFSISIDDFGTGYSSMNYLKRYPLNTLKIDRSFILELPNNINDVAITKAIIAMGKSLDIKIIAEGVETIEQLEFLATHQCDIAQGFLYGDTLRVDQVPQFIINKKCFASISS